MQIINNDFSRMIVEITDIKYAIARHVCYWNGHLESNNVA